MRVDLRVGPDDERARRPSVELERVRRVGDRPLGVPRGAAHGGPPDPGLHVLRVELDRPAEGGLGGAPVVERLVSRAQARPRGRQSRVDGDRGLHVQDGSAHVSLPAAGRPAVHQGRGAPGVERELARRGLDRPVEVALLEPAPPEVVPGVRVDRI